MKNWKLTILISAIAVFAFFALLWQTLVAYSELGQRTRLNSKLGTLVNVCEGFRGLHDRYPTNLNDIANLEDGAAGQWANRELTNFHGDRYEFSLFTNSIEVRVLARAIFPIKEVSMTKRLEFQNDALNK